MIYAAALLIAAALTVLQACGGSGDSISVDNIRDDPRLELYDNELTEPGQTHVPSTTQVPYETVPPYGGPHDSIPLPCGIYAAAPRFENAVHAMEHGAVVAWYSPRLLDEAQLSELSELIRGQLENGVYAVLAPYEALDTALTLVSWGTRLPLSSVEAAAITAYIDEFKHSAPEPATAGGCPTAR